MITAGKGAEREVPDVHLTRFAAYFVALNADQSKPEVRAQVRLVRHYGPYAPEFSDTPQERPESDAGDSRGRRGDARDLWTTRNGAGRRDTPTTRADLRRDTPRW